MYLSMCLTRNLLFAILLLTSGLSAQQNYRLRVIDADQKTPVSFASVVLRSGASYRSVICSEKGMGEAIGFQPDSIFVSCIGYRSRQISAATLLFKNGMAELQLQSESHGLQQVTVSASDEWAKSVIRRVLLGRDKHNFMKYGPMTYDTYQKTSIDVISSGDSVQGDTLKQKLRKKLAQRVPFISECVFATYRDGNRTEKTIRSQKMPGMQNPLLTESFVQIFHHALSFYQNSIPLSAEPITEDMANTEYLGPLSDGCLKSYNFQVENVIPLPDDTVYVIRFFPVRGYKFNALKGQLHISSKEYALKHVIAEPTEKGFIGLRVREDFQTVDGRCYPVDFRQELIFYKLGKAGKKKYYPAYVVHTHNSNFHLVQNTDVVRRTHRVVDVELLEPRQADSLQMRLRPDSLTTRELNGYSYLDTARILRSFDKILNVSEKLLWGCIPVKKFDLVLTEMVRYNSYERFRTGLGLYTNEKLSNFFSLGGYAGYGFGDKAVKYGAALTLFLHRRTDLQWTISWQHDLKAWGASSVTHYPTIFSDAYIQQMMWRRFDGLDEWKNTLSWRPVSDWRLTASVLVRDVRPLAVFSSAVNPDGQYKADEINLAVGYGHNERLMNTGNKVIVTEEGNPLFSLSYHKGINWLRSDALRYQKLEASFSFYLYHGLVGHTRLCIRGGYADRVLPAGLLYTGEGSKSDDLSVVVRNTFQTMSPNEFLSDKYMHLFFSHNFGSLLFRMGRFRPQFEVLHHMGLADLRNAADAAQSGYGVYNHLFLESGLMLNNLLKINVWNMAYFNLGIGGFYRYGHYAFEKSKDNLALKIGFGVTIK